MSASHSAGTTLLQMQIVINNIINKICSETKKTVKHEVIRVTALTTGSEAWWQSKNGPEWVREQESYRVTFWWRDPAGTQKSSAVKRVWLYITGVTDHHQNARPQSLKRIPDTDVWQWQGEFSPEWRGSYCFIPSVNENDFADTVFEGELPDRMALREGWRKLLPHAVSDPLNRQSWRGGRGHAVSALEMPDAPLPMVLADEQRLQQILAILLDNAHTYASPGSAVALRVDFQHNQVRFWVIDHGPGIPDAEKARVFDRFYSADPSRTDKHNFGLGLSVAKELARLHHADLTVTDTPGGGAKFAVTFAARIS